MKTMVLKLTIETEKSKRKALKVIAAVKGVDSVAVDMEKQKMTVIGEADPVNVTSRLRKSGFCLAELLSVEPTKEKKIKVENAEIPTVLCVQRPYYCDYGCVNDNPNGCTLC
ncbi:hypothetical protein SUGI_0124060 [Cryptomeria japonica]|nr:hypothetical protein SUGI_0124060 [Cryptomeria japonica]